LAHEQSVIGITIKEVMKLSLVLAVGVLLSALATSDARADTCTLTVNQSTYAYIGLGQYFSYGVDITRAPMPMPGPWPPPGPPVPQFSVVFVGTGIQAGGEPYPGLFPYGHSDLTGYQNPSSGGYSGVYQRQALVFNSYGFLICATNIVVVELQ
jgi:hypothetical protein